MSHEDLNREGYVETSSDRSFAFIWAAAFLLVGLWPLTQNSSTRLWAIVLAAMLLLIGLAVPNVLAPANKIWTKFGLILGRVISPLALAVVFFLVVTPIGVVMRLVGKDVLRLRRAADRPTYWLERRPPGPSHDSLSRQF